MISNDSIEENDDEGWEENVENFLKDIGNNDTKDIKAKPEDPPSNAKSRTMNTFAIMPMTYNFPGVSGTTRVNKIFASIDRN